MTSVAFSVRSLLKAPTFTLVALVTLALGIGVNTSMYTLMDVLLFRAAPFPEPERLVAICGTGPQTRRDGFAFVETEEMRALVAGSAKEGTARPLQSLTAFSYWGNTLSEPGRPAERMNAIDATADLLDPPPPASSPSTSVPTSPPSWSSGNRWPGSSGPTRVLWASASAIARRERWSGAR